MRKTLQLSHCSAPFYSHSASCKWFRNRYVRTCRRVFTTIERLVKVSLPVIARMKTTLDFNSFNDDFDTLGKRINKEKKKNSKEYWWIDFLQSLNPRDYRSVFSAEKNESKNVFISVPDSVTISIFRESFKCEWICSLSDWEISKGFLQQCLCHVFSIRAKFCTASLWASIVSCILTCITRALFPR